MQAAPLQFKIEGMDCAEEVSVLKSEIGPLVGGADRLSFDLLNSKLTVAAGPHTADSNAILRAVARTGMKAAVWQGSHSTDRQGQFWAEWSRTILTGASGLFTVCGFLAHAGIAGSILNAIASDGTSQAYAIPLAARICYGLGIIAGSWFVLPRAWLSLRRLHPDMNLLMLIACFGSVGLGDWFEASTVAFLFAFSLLLEKWSVGHARRAVESLLELTPSKVQLLQADGTQKEVLPADVSVNDRFLVKPAERFPLDGRVIQGNSSVNQAPITGESVPVEKGPGDLVFAGSINGEGALEVESTKLAANTTLARIVQMVAEAQARRSTSEQWVEKFAGIYTPVVLILSLVCFLIPPLVLGGSWPEWFYRSLVLLVIACPCALVISTPVSIVASLACAARQGVLVKGGQNLETPARLQAIAFDKTGTLTEGKPSVVEVVPLNGYTRQQLLDQALNLESHSEHPLGKAIFAFAQTQGAKPTVVRNFQILPGLGATALLDGVSFWIGSRRYLAKRGLETTEIHQKLNAMAQHGYTVVIMGNESQVCGLIGLSDVLRSSTHHTIAALRKLGIKRIVMLTGDSSAIAEAIGTAVGVDETQSELLPEQKVAAVEALVTRYGVVGMVGDGVNDAPAMVKATVGIAMGAVGSDAAIETADIALMSDDLSRLPWLIGHSRRTLGVIQQNIALSLSIKLIFMALTLFGYSSLWTAIAADMGASLIVIFNGLRLLRTHEQAD